MDLHFKASIPRYGKKQWETNRKQTPVWVWISPRTIVDPREYFRLFLGSQEKRLQYYRNMGVLESCTSGGVTMEARLPFFHRWGNWSPNRLISFFKATVSYWQNWEWTQDLVLPSAAPLRSPQWRILHLRLCSLGTLYLTQWVRKRMWYISINVIQILYASMYVIMSL